MKKRASRSSVAVVTTLSSRKRNEHSLVLGWLAMTQKQIIFEMTTMVREYAQYFGNLCTCNYSNGNSCVIYSCPWYFMLDNDKFGPGNRPIWEMKEGRVLSRYPDLIKALRRESDPSRRRQILTGHKTRIFGSSRGTVPTRVISQ